MRILFEKVKNLSTPIKNQESKKPVEKLENILRKKLLRKTLKIFSMMSLCSLLFVPLSVLADNHSANQDLRRALLALQAAKTYVAQAKLAAPNTSRLVFHYDALNRDIDRIMAGIEAKFSAEKIQPRKIPTISGDYLSLVGQTVTPATQHGAIDE